MSLTKGLRGMSKSEGWFDAGEAYWRDARISVGFESGRDEGVTRGLRGPRGQGRQASVQAVGRLGEEFEGRQRSTWERRWIYTRGGAARLGSTRPHGQRRSGRPISASRGAVSRIRITDTNNIIRP